VDIWWPDDGTDRRRIWLQFNGEGQARISESFGVDSDNKFGKTYLTFPVINQKAKEAVWAFDEFLILRAEKKKYWGEESPTVAEMKKLKTFRKILGFEKPMKDGTGIWPPNCKVAVDKKSKVVDHNGEDIDIHNVPGKRYESITIEILGHYFMGEFKFGVKKRLVALKLVAPGEDEDYNCEEELAFLKPAAAPPMDLEDSAMYT